MLCPYAVCCTQYLCFPECLTDHSGRPQVYDILAPLIKNLEAEPVLHLYSLLQKMEPRDHTEQVSPGAARSHQTGQSWSRAITPNRSVMEPRDHTEQVSGASGTSQVRDTNSPPIQIKPPHAPRSILRLFDAVLKY